MILLLPMLLRKKWRALAVTGLTVAFGLLVPFIFPGPAKSFILYREWIQSILAHGEDFPGMTSIDYLVRLIFPSWPSWGIFVILLSLTFLAALWIIQNIQKEKHDPARTGLADMNYLFECFLLIALLPNLIKTDWVLLLFSAPLITFIVFYTTLWKQYWLIPFLIFVLFFYGANSDDLLGREFSYMILHSGLMGLSNLVLVITAFFMFLDHRKRS
jgi:hypothetical protein